MVIVLPRPSGTCLRGRLSSNVRPHEPHSVALMISSPGFAPRRTARLIHSAWAGVSVVACLALALVPQQGHPPPIALIPAVALVWLTGHAVIWTLSWLYGKGQASVPSPGGASKRWPLALVVSTLGAGAGTVVGLLQLLGSAVNQRLYPYPDPALWTASVLACSAHAACLAGLLLRKPWSRALSALLALGWAALLGAQLVEHAAPRASLASSDNLLAIGLLALFVTLAGNLLLSRSVKAYFER